MVKSVSLVSPEPVPSQPEGQEVRKPGSASLVSLRVKPVSLVGPGAWLKFWMEVVEKRTYLKCLNFRGF